MKKPFYHLFATAALAAIIQSTSAQVLLVDNWQVGSANTQNPNQQLATRQTGTQALAPYNPYGSQTQVANPGTDVGQPGGPSNGNYLLLAFDSAVQNTMDLAAAATGPLVVDFDMYFHASGNPNNDNPTDWGAFTLQGNNEGEPWPIVGNGEFGFLTRYNGGIQVFQNGGGITPNGWDTTGFATADHWKLIFTDLAGTGSAFVGNGSKITMINGTKTLGTITLSQLHSDNLYPGFRQTSAMFIGLCNFSNSVVPATITQNLRSLFRVLQLTDGYV